MKKQKRKKEKWKRKRQSIFSQHECPLQNVSVCASASVFMYFSKTVIYLWNGDWVECWGCTLHFAINRHNVKEYKCRLTKTQQQLQQQQRQLTQFATGSSVASTTWTVSILRSPSVGTSVTIAPSSFVENVGTFSSTRSRTRLCSCSFLCATVSTSVTAGRPTAPLGDNTVAGRARWRATASSPSAPKFTFLCR